MLEAYRPSALSAVLRKQGEKMRELNGIELASVSGGTMANHSWAVVYQGADGIGNGSGGMCMGSDYSGGSDWQSSASAWLTAAASGVSTAIADCANGGQVGAILGAGAGFGVAGVGSALGAAIGGTGGCIYGAGVGLIRDLGKVTE